ncbi:ferredoxin [Marinitenerispora sediminis]|uniref:Ferredoxin n=1 Tax=Marinitenerispora sediminis TaxID=1931232 RepID=A0A368T5E6_9ACTN|nr:ferredoxin [Marinitenerispora sediminis]RCV50017.1 ferredoxin [Marinitenerispora sediminis]RCV54059.1 ferredoxin [Marinitenerispora sediminis]RCV58562.1 ferredoxin [Marinitenerispora sediminis]
MTRLHVDRERCAGAGMCVLTVPEVFDQDDRDGRVVVRSDTAAADPSAMRDAVTLCPSHALSLRDDP